MLNMIKMDFYRMFKTKSMYVIWFILAGLLLMGTFMSNYSAYTPEPEMTAQKETITETDDFRLGINVMLPNGSEETITVFDEFFANASGGSFSVLMVIFAVLFSTADISSGYIKNIGGQIENRGLLIISKAAALFAFTAITLIGTLGLQAILNWCVFGYLKWGDSKALVAYLLTQIIIHYALVIICAAIAVIVKNNVISMVIAICLTMNVMGSVYVLIDLYLEKLGIYGFEISRYTVTGQLLLLPMHPTVNDCFTAFLVAASFIAVMLTISSQIFQKRDI